MGEAPVLSERSPSYGQYSPFASRLIRDSKDSTIKSKFSPSAFEDAPNISTDATVDQEIDDEDEAIVHYDDAAHGDSANEGNASHRDRVLAVPEAGATSLVTPTVGRKAFATFDPTPYKKSVGRDYSRATIFEKTSAMHIYGGLGVLTLLGGVLHMCHVLPVSTKDKHLDKLARGIGERLINLSSSLNFWILSPTFHYSVDSGLIKFLPTQRLMDAIDRYLQDLHDLREKRQRGQVTLKSYNEAVNGRLRRKELFPNANYPYKIVGVLCQDDFLIPRHEVNRNQDFKMPAEEVHNEGTRYQIDIKRFPIPLRRTQESRSQDLLKPGRSDGFQTQDRHPPKTARVLRQFRVVDPNHYDEDEVFWLWQDPFFVLMNAGEFVRALRKRWENQHPDDEFALDSFMREKKHAVLLQRAYLLYEKIRTAPPPSDLARKSRETRTPSRPSRMTRSGTAPSRAIDKSRASTKTKDPLAAGSQRMAGTKRDASAMDGNDSRTEGTRRSRRLKLEEPEPDMDGQTQL
ncbi:hypothetical protein PQX77_014781 [Marasmius sp. AFHP31]|nr:hypothetical protein PQX77_014781 [Marasmius sp. AFHP31]